MIKNIINWIKGKQYLLYFSCAIGILDVYLRFINRTMKSFSVLDLIPNTFTIIWILVFCALLYISNKKLKLILTLVISTIFSIISFTQIIFFRIFSKFFSFSDLLYSGEGLDFFDSIFGYFKISDLIILLVIFFITLSIFSYRYISEDNKKQKQITLSIVIFIICLLIGFVQIRIGKSTDPTNWDSFANKRNIYNQFNDTKRSLMLCGLYEYSFRDFYITFIKNNRTYDSESIKEINAYFENSNKKTSKYNGIFKNKNLILIMLENIDTWMINEKAMPTLYNIQQKSIDFTEHYSVSYASGYTFNTEFIANTGLIPNITTFKTSYSFNKNNYEYSLANLFKAADYKTNSIHKNNGSFYNRDNMHLAWGYEKHYEYSTLKTNNQNIDLDTVVVSNNLNKFIYDEKFMTFYITYSAHMPYLYDKPECSENIEYIKKMFQNQNEEYLCAMSQAKVTDDAIKILVSELISQNKMEDTVLIFFTDHYAYSMNQEMVNEQKKETDANLKTKTPFFIYANDITPTKIDKLNSTLDILPTIADLFGLDYNPNIYFGESIFNEDYKELIIFQDKTWYDGNIYYKGQDDSYDKNYVEQINKYAIDLLNLGGKVIETDYFSYYDLNNKERME